MPLIDTTTLFVRAVDCLKKGAFNPYSLPKEFAVRTCRKDLAYIDDCKEPDCYASRPLNSLP